MGDAESDETSESGFELFDRWLAHHDESANDAPDDEVPVAEPESQDEPEPETVPEPTPEPVAEPEPVAAAEADPLFDESFRTDVAEPAAEEPEFRALIENVTQAGPTDSFDVGRSILEALAMPERSNEPVTPENFEPVIIASARTRKPESRRRRRKHAQPEPPEAPVDTPPEAPPAVEVEPAPVVAAEPAPVVAAEPAPVVAAEPAPVVAAEPAPVVEVEPAPVVAAEPAPVVEVEPALPVETPAAEVSVAPPAPPGGQVDASREVLAAFNAPEAAPVIDAAPAPPVEIPAAEVSVAPPAPPGGQVDAGREVLAAFNAPEPAAAERVKRRRPERTRPAARPGTEDGAVVALLAAAAAASEPPPAVEPSPAPAPTPAPLARAAEPPLRDLPTPAVGSSTNVEFAPRTGTRRLISVLLLLALAATAVAALVAYGDPTTFNVGLAATLGVLTLIVWGVRAGAPTTRLSVKSGQLEILGGGGRYVFDLASHYTPIEVVGKPGARGWKVLFLRRSMTPYVVDASMVDPEHFMRVLREYRPEKS